MSQLPQAANTKDNHEYLGDFTPIPIGEYIAQIIKSPRVENSKKTGFFIALSWKILSINQQGREHIDRLNLWNPSEKAVKIANKAANSISKACGKVGSKDSEEWHGIPVKLTFTKVKDTADGSTDISKYEAVVDPGALDLGPSESSQAAPVEPTKPATAGGGTPDWVNDVKNNKKLAWE